MMNSRLVWSNVCNWMVVAIAAGLLTACGGGAKSSPTTVNATLTIPVGEIAAFGTPSTFVISGSNLRNALFDERESTCTDFSISLKANDLIKFTCTPIDLNPTILVVNSKGEDAGKASITLPEPTDIRINSITADAGVALGKLSSFVVRGVNLYTSLLDPTDADNKPYATVTGCAELDFSGFADSLGTKLDGGKFSCIPISRTLVFTITTKNNKVILRNEVDLSAAPIAPLNITANIAPKLNQLTTFLVRGYFEDANIPRVTTSDCSGLTIVSSKLSGLIFRCNPQSNSATFNIINESNIKVGRTLLLPIWVRFSTSLGSFDVALSPTAAPITVANFLQYVDDGYYSNTIFHRLTTVEDDGIAVNQGGGFTSAANAANGISKPVLRAPIQLEPFAVTGLSNAVNTIAMARTNVLNSATSQFFINVAGNSTLDNSGGGYAVFGEVVSGADVLQTINKVPRSENNPQVPATTIIIQSVNRIQ